MRNVLSVEPPVEAVPAPRHCRKASMGDIHALLQLINGYAAQGRHAAAHRIRDVGEYPRFRRSHFPATAGRLRSAALLLARHRRRSVRWRWPRSVKSRGIGRALVEALEAEARQFGLHAIFAFTYVDRFFRKLGFVEVERGELPLKAWKDCLRCPKFQNCDEIAMVKYLTGIPDSSVLHKRLADARPDSASDSSRTERFHPTISVVWRDLAAISQYPQIYARFVLNSCEFRTYNQISPTSYADPGGSP